VVVAAQVIEVVAAEQVVIYQEQLVIYLLLHSPSPSAQGVPGRDQHPFLVALLARVEVGAAPLTQPEATEGLAVERAEATPFGAEVQQLPGKVTTEAQI
tara:strand:+ start:180 stop:476 length:297 start_codon:yes stop_codon:yes gene_type:complete